MITVEDAELNLGEKKKKKKKKVVLDDAVLLRSLATASCSLSDVLCWVAEADCCNPFAQTEGAAMWRMWAHFACAHARQHCGAQSSLYPESCRQTASLEACTRGAQLVVIGAASAVPINLVLGCRMACWEIPMQRQRERV